MKIREKIARNIIRMFLQELDLSNPDTDLDSVVNTYWQKYLPCVDTVLQELAEAEPLYERVKSGSQFQLGPKELAFFRGVIQAIQNEGE